MTLSDTFWLSLAGIIAGVISGTLIYINKSKCTSVNCCFGLLIFTRDVKTEAQLQEFNILHGVPSTPTLSKDSQC
jgi:hypothetical protein